MADYTEPSAVAPGTRSVVRYLEIPAVITALLAGAAFLTKMCYLSLVFNTIFVIVFLALFYSYVRLRLNIQIPLTLHQLGYRLPLRLTAFFAATIVFSLSAIYEIIELWDEIYFGGQRIWGPYDSATDLQWDLCGIIVGTLFSCIMLRDTRDRLVPH